MQYRISKGVRQPNLSTVFIGISVAQNRQNENFWYKFAKERIAYSIVTGLGVEEVRTIMPNFTDRCGF